MSETPAAASGGPGVKAIVVYPMNALANSQVGELEKFLKFGYPAGGEPVTFARYTGQESPDERRRILADPPDILLTNYVMLELVLTRPDERKQLVRAAQGLRFLALDELHTYRGRQGADVAMLVRRLRDQCAADDLQVIGTSATMSSEGIAGRASARWWPGGHPAVRRRGHPGAGHRRDPGPRHRRDRRATPASPLPCSRRNAASSTVRSTSSPPTRWPAWVETTFGLDLEPRDGPADPARSDHRPARCRRARRCHRASRRAVPRRASGTS